MQLQPQHGLRDFFRDGVILHSNGGHGVRLRADILRGGAKARPISQY